MLVLFAVLIIILAVLILVWINIGIEFIDKSDVGMMIIFVSYSCLMCVLIVSLVWLVVQ